MPVYVRECSFPDGDIERTTCDNLNNDKFSVNNYLVECFWLWECLLLMIPQNDHVGALLADTVHWRVIRF
jgi:hypothetical protein